MTDLYEVPKTFKVIVSLVTLWFLLADHNPICFQSNPGLVRGTMCGTTEKFCFCYNIYIDMILDQNKMGRVKRICVLEHSVMTNCNCACPAIQRG